MKYVLCMGAAFCLHLTVLVAQHIEHLCVQEPQAISASSWNGQPGGVFLPSKGLLNALVVFAQFPDDSLLVDHPEWPKDQPPRRMGEWVDSVWTGDPTPYSMTDYYNQMSMGQLKFIGKARFVVAPRTRAEYLALGMKRGDIHEELLKKLDSTVDFAEFDRWDLEDRFVHVEQSDKIVDLIVVIWRNFNGDIPDPVLRNDMRTLLEFPGDQAELGSIFQSMPVDNNNRRINMWYGVLTQNGVTEPTGSGPVISKGYLQHPFMSIMQTCIHEVGHYFVGGVEYHVGFGCWGMLSSYGIRNFSANSFERHRLGWITLNSLDAGSQPVDSATLPDYVTSGVAWRYVIDSATAQYFFIENHQGLSRWDRKSDGTVMERGVYVLRQDTLVDRTGKFSQLRMIPADGRHGWTVPRKETHSCCGTIQLPVFRQLAPDRHNGYHDCDRIPYIDPVTQQSRTDDILLMEDAAGATVLAVKFSGDGRDAFRMGYRQVFSPWSNPTSQDRFRNTTGFGFELTGVTTATTGGEVYTLNFHPQTAVDASPAVVEAFAAATTAQAHAVLSWQANEEPDLKWYRIYRATAVSLNEPPASAFQLVATLDARDGQGAAVTDWIDTNVSVGQGALYRLYYRIGAVDSMGRESVHTTSWVYDEPPQNGSGKRGAPVAVGGLRVEVYPNPAGRELQFRLVVPAAGAVSLQLCNALGIPVATVAEGRLEAGEHTLRFDASHLAGGVYVYRLSGGSGAVSGTVHLSGDR